MESAKCFDKWWDGVGGMSHWWTRNGRKPRREKWNIADTFCFQFVRPGEVSRIILRFEWKSMHSLYIGRSYIEKGGEIGKAIFWLCGEVSCEMQLAMTTKVMVLCSQSQRAGSRPNTCIKGYTWCPATSLECEVHPHFITQSQWLTFILYVAYITGWLCDALITQGARSQLNMIDQAGSFTTLFSLCVFSKNVSSPCCVTFVLQTHTDKLWL